MATGIIDNKKLHPLYKWIDEDKKEHTFRGISIYSTYKSPFYVSIKDNTVEVSIPNDVHLGLHTVDPKNPQFFNHNYCAFIAFKFIGKFSDGTDVQFAPTENTIKKAADNNGGNQADGLKDYIFIFKPGRSSSGNDDSSLWDKKCHIIPPNQHDLSERRIISHEIPEGATNVSVYVGGVTFNKDTQCGTGHYNDKGKLLYRDPNGLDNKGKWWYTDWGGGHGGNTACVCGKEGFKNIFNSELNITPGVGDDPTIETWTNISGGDILIDDNGDNTITIHGHACLNGTNNPVTSAEVTVEGAATWNHTSNALDTWAKKHVGLPGYSDSLLGSYHNDNFNYTYNITQFKGKITATLKCKGPHGDPITRTAYANDSSKPNNTPVKYYEAPSMTAGSVKWEYLPMNISEKSHPWFLAEKIDTAGNKNKVTPRDRARLVWKAKATNDDSPIRGYRIYVTATTRKADKDFTGENFANTQSFRKSGYYHIFGNDDKLEDDYANYKYTISDANYTGTNSNDKYWALVKELLSGNPMPNQDAAELSNSASEGARLRDVPFNYRRYYYNGNVEGVIDAASAKNYPAVVKGKDTLTGHVQAYTKNGKGECLYSGWEDKELTLANAAVVRVNTSADPENPKWVEGEVSVYDGSKWVEAETVNVYNGSEWVEST